MGNCSPFLFSGYPFYVRTPTYLIHLPNLLQQSNPVRNPPWKSAQDLACSDVWAAFHAKRHAPTHTGHNATREAHSARIAWMMAHPDPTPITLKFRPCTEYFDWVIADGNHRVYAATLLEQTSIRTHIEGCLEEAAHILGDLIVV